MTSVLCLNGASMARLGTSTAVFLSLLQLLFDPPPLCAINIHLDSSYFLVYRRSTRVDSGARTKRSRMGVLLKQLSKLGGATGKA